MTYGQNTRHQIASDRRSTRVIKLRSVHFIRSLWKSKQMLATYMQHMCITSWRLELRAVAVK